MTPTESESTGIARTLQTQVLLLGGTVALMWGIEICDWFLGGSLDRFGIRPRSIDHLWGILFAPFLHGNFRHLIANTIPFLTLGWFVMLRRTSDWIWVTAIATLIGGIGTWLIAPSNTIHIGASGVVFGYLGFLISRGYFERRFSSMLLSVFVGVLYGGLVLGVFPSDPRVSWQGHLFGFIGGIVAAKLIATDK
jgi:membrane associated rhomboid family serine protease